MTSAGSGGGTPSVKLMLPLCEASASRCGPQIDRSKKQRPRLLMRFAWRKARIRNANDAPPRRKYLPPLAELKHKNNSKCTVLHCTQMSASDSCSQTHWVMHDDDEFDTHVPVETDETFSHDLLSVRAETTLSSVGER